MIIMSDPKKWTSANQQTNHVNPVTSEGEAMDTEYDIKWPSLSPAKQPQKMKPMSPIPQNSGADFSSDDEEDPFANLPPIVPVPISIGSSISNEHEMGVTQFNSYNNHGSYETPRKNFGTERAPIENFESASFRGASSTSGSYSLTTGRTSTNTGGQTSFRNAMGQNYSGIGGRGHSSGVGRSISGHTHEYNRYKTGKSTVDYPSARGYQGTKQSYSSSLYQHSPKSPVENIKELDILGKFDCIPHSSKKFEIVSKYVNNSCGLSESQVKVQVHDVYEINRNDWISYLKSLYTMGNSGGEQKLLWYKTSTKGIQRLAQQNDGCVAFYDRMGRALPGDISTMQKPLRQLMILCSVSLGKMYESPHGFQHWSLQGYVPKGYCSIVGTGKYIPNWRENVEEESVSVPLGKTVINQKFPAYSLQYNEYMVFEAWRIKVKYAVDVEIVPATIRRQRSYETQL